MHWRFLGLSRDAGVQVHTLSALLFIIADDETLKSAANHLGTEVIQILKYILIENDKSVDDN